MSVTIAELQRKKDAGEKITMITTYGIMQNKHSGVVQNEVLLDSLFT